MIEPAQKFLLRGLFFSLYIMEAFGLSKDSPVEELKTVGELKSMVKEAVLDGLIPNEHEPAYNFMLSKAKEFGLTPIEK